MSGTRRHVRLVLDGRKLEVTTNALDMVRGERDGEGPVAMGFRVIHQALLRQHVEGVPASFERFLEQLDDMDDLTDEGDGEDGDGLVPTGPTG